MSPQQAKAWTATGDAARAERPPSEIQQQALAALLHPIANVSCHSWFHDLADGIDALTYGEVLPIVTPSPRGLTGTGKGRTAWQLRLGALQWVEFQVAARLKTKTEGYERVADAFGRTFETVKEWPSEVPKRLGKSVVREALEMSRRVGKLVHSIREQGAKGEVKERDRRYLKHLEVANGDPALKKLAAMFNALPRQRRDVGK